MQDSVAQARDNVRDTRTDEHVADRDDAGEYWCFDAPHRSVHLDIHRRRREQPRHPRRSVHQRRPLSAARLRLAPASATFRP